MIMTQQEAIKELKRHKEEFFTDHGWNISVVDAIDDGVKALELLGTLTDRPCSVCKHHQENGCSQWSCVFELYIAS